MGPSQRYLSGITYYTLRLANAASQKHTTSVICLRELLPRFLFPGAARVGDPLTSLTFDSDISLFDGMDYHRPISWLRAGLFLRTAHPEVLLVPWWTGSVAHMLLFLLVFNRLSPRARAFVIFHESNVKQEAGHALLRAYSSWVIRLVRRFADGAFVHSDEEAIEVAERTGLSHSRIHVIPQGLWDHYPRLSSASSKQALGLSGRFVFLNFGLIRRYKGVLPLIAAFEDLPSDILKRCHLLIVGEIWEDRHTINERIAHSPARGEITLVSRFVSDNEAGRFFSAADATVLPYTRASGSGVLHIAMSYGHAIVASAVGGLREALDDYGSAYLVAPGDTDELREGLLRAYDDAGNRATEPPPHLSWESVIGKIQEAVTRQIGASVPRE